MLQAGSKTVPVGLSEQSLTGKVLQFTKIEHSAFSLPLVLAGAWIGTGGAVPPLPVLVWIVLAAVGARIFGMAFNRIFDRHIDAQNPRTAMRELPSGRLSIRTALAIASGGLGGYLAACAALGGWCLTLAPLPLIPLLGYSLLKRVTVLCHFGIGLCLALAPLGAFVAAAGHLRFSPAVLAFAGFVFFWLSGADMIYAISDIASDRENRIHSLPARFGRRAALGIAAACHVAAVAFLAGVFVITGSGAMSLAAFSATVLVLALAYLPSIPVEVRFFPILTIAGLAGAFVPILGYH